MKMRYAIAIGIAAGLIAGTADFLAAVWVLRKDKTTATMATMAAMAAQTDDKPATPPPVPEG